MKPARLARAALLALLAAAPLAACDRDPTLAVPAELVGTWYQEAPVSGVDYLPIAGTRDVVLGAEWEFRANGTFLERHYARELEAGTVSERGVYAGTFSAEPGGVLHLRVQAEATAAAGEGAWPVDLSPEPLRQPRSLRLSYALADGQLYLATPCPPGASCAAVPLERRPEPRGVLARS